MITRTPTDRRLLQRQNMLERRLEVALPPKTWMSICSKMYIEKVLICGKSPRTKMSGKKRMKR